MWRFLEETPLRSVLSVYPNSKTALVAGFGAYLDPNTAGLRRFN